MASRTTSSSSVRARRRLLVAMVALSISAPRLFAQGGAVGPITFAEAEFPRSAGFGEGENLTEHSLQSLDGAPIPELSFSDSAFAFLAFGPEDVEELTGGSGSLATHVSPIMLASAAPLRIDFGADVSGVAFDAFAVAGDDSDDSAGPTVVTVALTLVALEGGTATGSSAVSLVYDQGSGRIGQHVSFSAPGAFRALEIELDQLESFDFTLLALDNLSYTFAVEAPPVTLEPEQTLSSTGSAPASAVGPNGQRVVVWSDSGAIFGSLYDPEGQPVSEAFRVDSSGGGNDLPAATFDASGNVLIAWQRAGGASARSTASLSGCPAVGFASHGVRSCAPASSGTILARSFDPTGIPTSSEVALPVTGAGAPSISTAADGGAVVTFDIGGKARGQRLAPGLQPQGGVFEVAEGGLQEGTRVATAATGDFTVTWVEGGTGSTSVLARFFRADGSAKGAPVQVSLPGSVARAPAVAVDAAGNAVVAFERDGEGDSDVYVRRYAADGRALGDPQRAHVSADGEQTSPSVGVNPSGDFAVAWVDGDLPTPVRSPPASTVAAAGSTILARGFNTDGAGGAEVTVASSDGSTAPDSPQITIDNGDEISVSFRRRKSSGESAGVFSRRVETPLPSSNCAPGPERLCLDGGRFGVEVTWSDFDGRTGIGNAVPLTDDTGTFWFFDAANVELVIKVLDATSINGNFWVYYGALSNVEFTVTVDDAVTGQSVSYYNPLGTFASVGDTEALPGDGGAASVETGVRGIEAPPAASSLRVTRAARAGCATQGPVLCVQDSQFEVTVAWKDFEGRSGTGEAVQLSDDTGSFWFFDPDNVEVVIKVLDARAINGKFWVYYGALSNLELEITVRNTETGDSRVYHNPLGTFASVGDTDAL